MELRATLVEDDNDDTPSPSPVIVAALSVSESEGGGVHRSGCYNPYFRALGAAATHRAHTDPTTDASTDASI